MGWLVVCQTDGDEKDQNKDVKMASLLSTQYPLKDKKERLGPIPCFALCLVLSNPTLLLGGLL